jgi:Protein of unknown function (DUF2917)
MNQANKEFVMFSSAPRIHDLNGTVYLRLREDKPVTITGPGRLRVLRGRAWVTVSDRPDDWFLVRGEDFDLPATVRTVVQADPRCVLSVRLVREVAPMRTSWAGMVARVVAGMRALAGAPPLRHA